MKLVDCFMYFDEDMLLDVRLHTLDAYVDKFVISESAEDHSGKKKKLNFNINNFPKFKDKISYIVVEKLPKNISFFKKNWSPDWVRENFHRNSLAEGYKNFSENDLIMISDLDEIPNPKKISEFQKKQKYACFMQKNFQQKINLLNTSQQYWAGTKICQKKYLKSPQWLRDIKTKKRPFWKFYKAREPQLIMDGGWHFSFLKNSIDISKKIKSYAHQEYHLEKYTDIKKIEEKLNQKSDLFDRDYKYEKIDLNQDFPEYILKNKKKFDKWII